MLWVQGLYTRGMGGDIQTLDLNRCRCATVSGTGRG